MECQYCKSVLSTKSALTTHQTKTKYCLKIQGKDTVKGEFVCKSCNKDFFNNNRYKSHSSRCRTTSFYEKGLEKMTKMIDKLKTENLVIVNENRILQKDKKDLQERYDKLSLTAVKRPVTNNKNIQINNYIQQMDPIKMEDIAQSVPMLTLDHHVKGAEGYAEFALEFPFKNKIVCVDVNRNKIKYKNDEGDLIEDVGFRKMMTKLCGALKERSFSLSQEHYEKLSDSFSDSEMDGVNFMETALAITKCANGKETDFCNKIIKIIGKCANVANRGLIT